MATPLSEFNVANIQIDRAKKAIYLTDKSTEKPLVLVIGSKDEPLECAEGLMKVWENKSDKKKKWVSTKRTMVVETNTAVNLALRGLFENIEHNDRLPASIKDNFLIPFKLTDSNMRIGVDDNTDITIFRNGEEVGDGSVNDILPGSKVAMAVKFSIYSFKNDDDELVSGVSMHAQSLMLDVSNAVAEPPKKKMKW